MVQREDGSGKRRTLHRNLLLPIGCIDSDYEEKRPIPKPRSRTQQEERKEKDRKTDSDQQNEEADRYESSDSESDIQLAVPVQKRTPIEDAREPTVREEATRPERVTAENPAPQIAEVDGSGPRSSDSEENTENTLRRSARVRRPPNR